MRRARGASTPNHSTCSVTPSSLEPLEPSAGRARRRRAPVKKSHAPASLPDLHRDHRAAAGRARPRARSRARSVPAPGRGRRGELRSTRRDRRPRISQLDSARTFHLMMAGRGDPALRALLRRAPRRGARLPAPPARRSAPRTRGRRRSCARSAPTTGSSTAGTCARGCSRSRPASRWTSCGAKRRRTSRSTTSRERAARRPSSAPAASTASSSTSPDDAAADRARRGRAALRLRPSLRRDRRRARLVRGGRARRRVVRRPQTEEEP